MVPSTLGVPELSKSRFALPEDALHIDMTNNGPAVLVKKILRMCRGQLALIAGGQMARSVGRAPN